MVDIFNSISKNKLSVFNAYPYPAQVIVYKIGEEDKLKKVFPDHPEIKETTLARSCAFRADGCNIITMGFRDCDENISATIAHECYHAMNYCYFLFGCHHDTTNDEAGAYFIGHLVREVSKRVEDIFN